MELTKEEKHHILSEHLRNISHIASKEYQKRIWIRGEGPEVDSFDDTVCDFFGEGDSILEKYKDFGISEPQHALLLRFRNEFEVFCDGPAIEYYLPENFIDTLEWARIINLAKDVLKAFDYEKNA